MQDHPPGTFAINNARRRPRFARVSPLPIRLTSDDLAVIGHVDRFRFLRSTHLADLMRHRSARKLVNRLGTLYHAGYLDRPRAQIEYFTRSGSAPLVYALGNRGAEVVAELHDTPLPASDWTDKNRNVKRPYIEHALLVADFMIAVERTLADRKDIALIDVNSMRQSTPGSAPVVKSSWMLTADYVHAGAKHTLSANPDAVFGLHFRKLDRRSYFFVEADRGTMPITRTTLAQTSFKRRLFTYLSAHKAKSYVNQFGFHNLRVLTVTTSRERVASMIDAVNDLTGGKGCAMFLFTDLESLRQQRDPLSLPWSSTAGPIQLDQPPRVQPTRI
jgi:Replication-relaxation